MVVLTKELEDTHDIAPPLERVPRHVAIIMDGNGRWAKARGLPRTEGHRQGTENLRRLLRSCVELGIEILTIYAFSTENWARPAAEVQMLMKILEMVIDRELKELDANGVQIRHIGELGGIAPGLQKKIRQACEYTRHNSKLVLNVAFNYGGRDEIVHAVRRIVEDNIPAAQIDEKLISRYLYTSDLPDPDLIIRTSGELRISNFLIWQGAYSELYSTPTYWPDFDKDELRKALVAYGQRKRRFGQTDDQIDHPNG
ncbi:MAG: isoprenyl transferase [Chloroflexota bacterium]|nr:isoprenyl transferase [Chloroflexota bacterium]